MLQNALVLRPAVDLRSKLAMLASLLHPGDAGLVLCLAERGSHAAKLIHRAHSPSRSTHEPLQLWYWVQGLRRQQLNQVKTVCPPAQTTVSSAAIPATSSEGREALAKDTLIHRPRQLDCCLPPRMQGFAAVTRNCCTQTKRVMDRL